MKSLYPSMAVLFTVVAICSYVYLGIKQFEEFIRTQPTCFPPYILMRESARQAPQGAYRSHSFAIDEGVRSLAVPSAANRPSLFQEDE